MLFNATLFVLHCLYIFGVLQNNCKTSVERWKFCQLRREQMSHLKVHKASLQEEQSSYASKGSVKNQHQITQRSTELSKLVTSSSLTVCEQTSGNTVGTQTLKNVYKESGT